MILEYLRRTEIEVEIRANALLHSPQAAGLSDSDVIEVAQSMLEEVKISLSDLSLRHRHSRLSNLSTELGSLIRNREAKLLRSSK